MKYVISAFGSNSILAKNFIEQYSNDYRIIGLQRKDKFNFDNKLFKLLKYDLSKNLFQSEIQEISKIIIENKGNCNLVFILFAWAGKPRDHKINIASQNYAKNKMILENIFRISKVCKPSRIVFISSAGAIYSQNSKVFSTELCEPDPKTSYGVQKLIAEKLLKSFCNSEKMPLTILRVSSAFGYNPLFPDQGVINKWLFDAKNKNSIRLFNHPKSFVNFISFENISKSINVCIKKKISGIYNIGSTKSVSLENLIEIIMKITKKSNLEIEIIGKELRSFYLDTSLFKIISELEFNQNFEEEVKNIFSLINKP